MELNGINTKATKMLNMDATFDTDLCQSREDKIEQISFHFKKIMQVLNLDLNDPSLKDTPNRVAKMYVDEVFKGLNKDNFPKISLFNNDYSYDEMIIVNDITLFSYCEHHFVPFIGKVHVAYYPNKKVIGLSKINRVIDFISKKPQVQERLTVEIAYTLSELLETEHVAVYIEAKHLCVASRGVKDTNSLTKTGYYLGKFKSKEVKREFFESF